MANCRPLKDYTSFCKIPCPKVSRRKPSLRQSRTRFVPIRTMLISFMAQPVARCQYQMTLNPEQFAQGNQTVLQAGDLAPIPPCPIENARQAQDKLCADQDQAGAGRFCNCCREFIRRFQSRIGIAESPGSGKVKKITCKYLQIARK